MVNLICIKKEISKLNMRFVTILMKYVTIGCFANTKLYLKTACSSQLYIFFQTRDLNIIGVLQKFVCLFEIMFSCLTVWCDNFNQNGGNKCYFVALIFQSLLFFSICCQCYHPMSWQHCQFSLFLNSAKSKTNIFATDKVQTFNSL